MVIHPEVAPILVLLLAMASIPGPASMPAQTEGDPQATADVREALSDGRYPWYDTDHDTYRPIMPPKPPKATGSMKPWLEIGELNLGDLGRLIVFVLLAAGLSAMVVFAARSWRRMPRSDDLDGSGHHAPSRGAAARVVALPIGLEVDESDPMEAARIHRGRGDLGRSIILLFTHQVLELDRLKWVRIAPGRTGRQLVRSIADSSIRGSMERTLRLFEEVYYGHREPSPIAFEAAWAEAEALEARFAAGAAS